MKNFVKVSAAPIQIAAKTAHKIKFIFFNSFLLNFSGKETIIVPNIVRAINSKAMGAGRSLLKSIEKTIV